MTQMAYCVGIDLGTTYSAAVVCRVTDPRPETVPLGDHSTAVASMVFLAPDGSMLCGEAAHRRAVTDPRRVVREFKRRIGDGTPLIVGGCPVAPETVAARFVAWILEQVAEREGGPARGVVLTHPAEWGPHKRAALELALADQGVDGVQFLSEPEAAAVGYASTEHVAVGATVAVYDLGGGTFDAAVVRKGPDGAFELLGPPVGIERLGGIDFDEAVFEHVRTAVDDAWGDLDPADPAVQSAVAGLRRECTAAKEALSADTEVTIPVMLPGHHTQVRLGRAEFEERIRPAVVETVEALRRAMAGAGTPSPDAVLMVGGSSRVPLVAQLVSAELGTSVAVDADPKSVVATGAAVTARGPIAPDVEPDVERTAPGPGGVPVCPPLDLGPVLGEPEPAAMYGSRRARTLALAGALSVVATLGMGVATVATGVDPGGAARSGTSLFAPGADAAEPVAGAVDPWTGTAPIDTTVAGPKRPMVVAAVARPGARLTPTGAPGASPATGAALPGPPDRVPTLAGSPALAPGVPGAAPAPPAPVIDPRPAAVQGGTGGTPAPPPRDPMPVPGPSSPPAPAPVDPPAPEPTPVDPPTEPSGPAPAPVDPAPAPPADAPPALQPPADPAPADPVVDPMP